MTKEEPILLDIDNGIATMTLNRPEKHNAFDGGKVELMQQALKKIANNDNVRVVIFKAKGKNFCAGADLNWMKQMTEFTAEQNEEDALKLAQLLRAFNKLSKPIIALAQGRSMGGGNGLLACCDVVIASDNAQFCFSEVKLGLIPATIAPYILRTIGYSHARRYFLTAEMMDVSTAKHIGLVHEIVKPNDLEKHGYELANDVMKNGPQTLAACKRLINALRPVSDEVLVQTASLLAKVRCSEEAQQALKAFLEKNN